jgi:predicted DNA-binding transcriptional regulator YafY
MSVKISGGSSGGGRKRRKPRKPSIKKIGKTAPSNSSVRKKKARERARIRNKKAQKEREEKSAERKREKAARDRTEAFPKGPATKMVIKTKDNILQLLRSASNDRKVVEVLYRSSQGARSRRRVEPYSIYYDSAKGYRFECYCLLRECMRSFYLSNITEAYTLADIYKPRYDVTFEKDYQNLKGKKKK